VDKINIILSNLRNNISQSLVRVNDGELIAITQGTGTISRGAQEVNSELSFKLKEVIKHKQDNYWIGLPCSSCYPGYAHAAAQLVDKDYPYLTKAVVITNRNLKFFTQEFPKCVNDKTITWVSGEDQNIEGLQKIGIKISKHIKVPTTNAWSEYKNIVKYKDFVPGEIVLCSCGPLSRVLVKEWFERHNTTTFLDLGCVFDPYTRDKWMRVHLGTLPPCKECN